MVAPLKKGGKKGRKSKKRKKNKESKSKKEKKRRKKKGKKRQKKEIIKILMFLRKSLLDQVVVKVNPIFKPSIYISFGNRSIFEWKIVHYDFLFLSALIAYLPGIPRVLLELQWVEFE